MASLSITRRAAAWQWVRPAAINTGVLLAALLLPAGTPAFHFALLGDRTGEAQPGVYAEAWREAAAEVPAFVLTVGDTIQGYDDKSMNAEWREVMRMIAPYRRFKLFLTPGNHDVWDEASVQAYVKYSRHPLHYSFNWRQAHFTILNDSESDDLKPGEIEFLTKDLEANKAQEVKFIVMHRPSWLFHVVLGDPKFALHELARKYGVQYVIAGHIHQMLHFELESVMYLSMASSGGHLRDDKSYRHGWFFEHTDVEVNGGRAVFRIEELKPPYGQGRVSRPGDWGAAGLISDVLR